MQYLSETALGGNENASPYGPTTRPLNFQAVLPALEPGEFYCIATGEVPADADGNLRATPKRYEWFSTLEAFEDRMADLAADPNVEVWFSPASYSGKRRVAANVALLAALRVDIDLDPEAGFGDVVSAIKSVVKLAKSGRIPAPTHVVKSGTGAHVYWGLSEAVPPHLWSALAAKLKTVLLATEPRLGVDVSRWSDTNGLLRWPGTMNRKRAGAPTLVRGVSTEVAPHDPQELADTLDRLAPAPTAAPVPTASARSLDRSARFAGFGGVGGREDPERVVSALLHLAPKRGKYHAWVAEGFSLKHAVRAGELTEVEASHVWLQFCRAAPAFVDDATALAKWDKLEGDSRNPRKLASIFAAARTDGWIEPLTKLHVTPQPPMSAEVRDPNAAGKSEGSDTEAEPSPRADGREAIPDRDIALWIARRQHGRLLYDHTRRAWMVFDGATWAVSRQGVAEDRVSALCAEAGYGNAGKARNVSQVLQNLPGVSTTSDQFDRDPWLIGVPSGFVDLRTGVMHAPDPGKMISKRTAVDPAPAGAMPKRFLRCLNDWFAGDRDTMKFVLRYLGYSLSGDMREQVLAFFHGAAGSGKSTLLQTVGGIMGDYHTAGNMGAILSQGRGDPHAASPYLAALVGARFVTLPETKVGMQLDGPTVAKLTGNDAISTRHLHRDAFVFTPTAKIAMYGNQAPGLSGSSAALARRLLCVPMNAVFKGAVGGAVGPVIDLQSDLKTEWPQILRVLIDACGSWQRHGLGAVPAVIAQASQEYVRNADPIRSWVDDCLVPDVAGHLVSTTAYESWVRWCGLNGRESGSSTNFGQRLSEVCGSPDRRVGGKGARIRSGWRLVV